MDEYSKERGFLAAAPVHARIIQFGEMDRFDAQLATTLNERFPGVDYMLVTRPHPDRFLDGIGDRLRVALRVRLDG